MAAKSGRMQQEHLEVNGQTITYTLTLAKRKSVGITVHADGRVAVRAPQAMSREEVAQVIRKRANWILSHQQKFADRPAMPAAPKDGKSYLYLGQQLPIVVEPLTRANHAAETVEVKSGKIRVRVKDPSNSERVKREIGAWVRTQAEVTFLLRMATLISKFKEYKLKLPDLKVRVMKARWGSCSTNGTVTLNLKLIHMEPALIDYVIVHELCHLIEHNHSKHFYGLLTRMMPDWQKWLQRLNEIGMPD